MESARLPCCTILRRLSRKRVGQLGNVGAGLFVGRDLPERFLQFVDQLHGNAGEIVDEVERVLDLVGDASGELAQRSKLLGLHQAILSGAQIFERFRELARALLLGLEQADVLDGDRRLVGERRNQLDLLSVNGRTSVRVKVKTPTETPSRSIGTPSNVRKPPSCWAAPQV